MSSVNRSRITKRMHQACENCRRKKTRCPGERPACSTCSRLYQLCHYADGNVVSEHPRVQGGSGRDLEGRLAQLEEKMDLMLDRAKPDSQSEAETPRAFTRGPSSHQTTPGTSAGPLPLVASASSPNSLPSKEIIAETVDLYFRYCHRQPLWLFERDDFASLDDCCEEVIFSLLALTVRFSNREFFEGRAQELSHRYAEVARGHIMFRIAQGTVQLSTIQSLCLLALANFVAKDTHLAWLHISLANSLSQSADMDVESNHGDFSQLNEAKRRVFYSIHLLNQLYAPRSMMLNMLEDIQSPKWVGFKQDPLRDSSKPPPLMPQQPLNDPHTQNSGIWTYMVQQTSLWREVRNYVAHCADGNPNPPWSPDSGYSVIGAHLMDSETRFPTYLRYDAVRFLDRTKEELQHNRHFWTPWLYLQFAYHAIHSVLNHPFLYSARPHQTIQMTVPNTFWKTSSELALLHSTWTVRLIDMVSEKDYRVSDPFIGHCASIAATIHLYYCRAADNRVRNSAQSRLTKCMRFVGELGTLWPVCQLMYDRLDALVQSAFGTDSGEEESNRRTVSINTALMWDILDYTRPNKYAQKPGRGLFDPTFVQDPEEEEEEEQTVETQIFHRPNPTADVDISNGGQELPPYSDAAVRQRTRGARGRTGHSARHWAPVDERQSLQQQQQQEPPDFATWPGPAMLGNSSIMDITHDPFFQFQDHGSPYLGFWEIGNL